MSAEPKKISPDSVNWEYYPGIYHDGVLYTDGLYIAEFSDDLAADRLAAQWGKEWWTILTKSYKCRSKPITRKLAFPISQGITT